MRQLTKIALGLLALPLLMTNAKASGVINWVKIFDGNQTSSYDNPVAIGYDGDGNVYTGGTTVTTGNGSDFYINKRNPAGTTLYTKIVNVTNDDTLRAMTVDISGNVYVVGEINSGTGNSLYTFKLNSAGTVAWNKTYAAQFGGTYAYDIKLDSNTDVYVLGQENAANAKSDLTLIKYANLDGAPQWSRRRDSGENLHDSGRRILVNGDDHIVIAGSAGTALNGADLWILKYDGAGTLQWEKKWDSPFHANDHAYNAALGPNDKIYVAGGSAQGVGTPSDCITLCFDTFGNLIWEKRFDGFFGNDLATSIVVDNLGNATICGIVRNQAANYDALVIKYSPTGLLLWKKTYNGPADGDDFAAAITLDVHKNVTVALTEFGVGSKKDIRVLRLNGTNGTQMWSLGYNGVINDDDSVVATAGFLHGEVGVLGVQESSATFKDMVTMRIAQPPIGTTDKYTVVQGTTLSRLAAAGVLVNDLYVGPGIAIAIDLPDNGMLTLNNDGGFDYVPDANFVGIDTFSYRVNRGGWLSPFVTVAIQVVPVVPASLTLNPTSVYGGFSSTATVTMTHPAPPGGVVVNLSTASSSILIDPSVFVPEGASQATFTVNTTNVGAEVVRFLSASRAGVTKSAGLTIKPYPVLNSLSLNPASIGGGGTVVGTVGLSFAAPAGGVLVDISDNSTAVFTPVSVTVPAGATSVDFNVGTAQVAAQAIRTVTATMQGVSKTANITLLPISLTSVTANPSTVVGGQPTTGTVHLNGPAPAGGITVTLTPNSTVLVTAPSVFVPAGATSAQFAITTKPVGVQSVRTITATYNGVSKNVAITLMP